MEIIKFEDKLIFVYYYSDYYPPNDWIKKELNLSGTITIKNTFNFKSSDQFDLSKLAPFLHEDNLIEDLDYPSPKAFILSKLKGDYFYLDKEKLGLKNDLYIHKNCEISIDYFIAEKKISVFKQIDNLVKEDIYIGGDEENVIPIQDFVSLIQNFPTTYEKKIYAEARIASIIRNYFETTKDAEKTFQNYINKKPSKKGVSLNNLFQEYEIIKFTTILEKLQNMLNSEEDYNELQWQKEILDIILLLYPKYIKVFKSSFIKADGKNFKFLDFMLIDFNGNIDIIEIKKPFANKIMTKTLYRNNHIPRRELTGSVMQLEKYIYHLNRWGEKGEKYLSKKYLSDLPDGLKLQITNPKGFIIMGRENNLTKAQLNDFEIVKRKYKNVIDIITYDDLIERLKFTIEQIKKNESS